MGRPPLSVSTFGKIRAWREANGQWTARCRFRDADGQSRLVERTRPTKAAAERALKEALRDRGAYLAGSVDVTAETKVAALAEAWWTHFERLDRSPGTKQIYRDRVDRQVIPGLGAFRVRELSVGTVERFLRTVEDHHGPALAKTTRSVLSGMCAYAARHDALGVNPVRETTPISVKPKKGAPEAMTIVQIRQLRALMTYDPKAVELDLPDIVGMLAASGLRIGECLAIVWDAIDFKARTVEVRGTVIRIKGNGLIIKPAPKSEAGWRKLVLPQWCIELLEDRLRSENMSNDLSIVFPSTVGTLREPTGVDKQLKRAFIQAGFPKITSHWLRKSVATAMDEAGLSARNAADQLGHARPSITQDVYFGRGVADTGAAVVLEAIGF